MRKKRMPIIDLHSDFVLSCYEGGEQFGSKKQTNFEMLKRNNINILLAGFSYDDLLKDTEKQLQVLLDFLHKNQNAVHIKDKTDLLSVLKNRKQTGFIIHLEGAGILNGKMECFEQMYKKGVRSVGLTHSRKNCLGSGNKENPNDSLSDFGKKIVKETQKRNIILDLAHLNEKGFYEALSLISTPPLVSHSCAYTLCPNQRNLKDEQIKEIAKLRGVVGIFFSSKFVNSKSTATVEEVANHFVHIASIGGVETVAIGSDFGGITTGLPKGLESVDKLSRLFLELKKKGFTKKEIEMISYENAERVLLNTL